MFFVKLGFGREVVMAGTFGRLITILKSAPRQILAAYRKGYSEAPRVPPPEALLKRQSPSANPKPPREGPPIK